MSRTLANELLRKRAGLVDQARDLYRQADEEKRALTGEERETWDRIMSDVDRLDEEARRVENDLAKLEALALAREDTKEDMDRRGIKGDAEERMVEYRNAFWRYMAGGKEGVNAEQRQVLETERRAFGTQVKGTDASGGYLVPEDFRAELMVALKDFGGMREAARVITTATGRDLPWPRSDDTGNAAKLIAEATAISTTSNVPFGSVTLEAHMYHSGPIKISHELDQDAELPIDSIVMDAMRVRFGRAWNTHMTTRSSTEATGPHGVINDSTGAVTLSGGAAALTSVNTLIDLQHSVDPAYRRQPGTVWMFNDTTAKLIRKIRENSTAGTGNYLWEPRITAGQQDTLLGYPVVINQDFNDFSTSGVTKPVLFGNLRYYIIRDVRAMWMKRLEERFAEEGVYALLAYARTDGRGVLPSTSPARKPYRFLLSST